MKRSNNKRPFGVKLKHFFSHYFGLLLLAIVCAVLLTVVICYGIA